MAKNGFKWVVVIENETRYNINVAAPILAKEGGVDLLELLLPFLISVLASIAAYYICKWLDRNDNGNQPKD